MKNENPHVPDSVIENAKHYLPMSDPMNQPGMLTQLQAAYLPALMWLLDTQRYRAQGRSVLVAHALIRLAMQGETIYLEDVSTIPTMGTENFRRRSHFANVVLRICDEHYKGHRFDFNHQRFTLSYKGQHPR